MDRWTFIGMLAGELLAAPLIAEAQSGRPLPCVGYLSSGSRQTIYAAAFREGLRDLGLGDGQSVRVEYRFADGNLDRLPGLVDELLRCNPRVIFAGVFDQGDSKQQRDDDAFRTGARFRGKGLIVLSSPASAPRTSSS
jgi:hypothetical protein